MTVATPKLNPFVIQGRCHCLRAAVDTRKPGEAPASIIARAKEFERFVLQVVAADAKPKV
jgi:hypothetical protein